MQDQRLSNGKRKKTARWKRVLDKEMERAVKEKVKRRKKKDKIRRKALKARKKKIEKSLDRILVGICFLLCLSAALLEAKQSK